MICSEKERESCNVEKLGCNGCFYRELTNEEIEQCIKDLTEIRPEMLDDKGLKLFKTIMQILDERDKLRADNYKANNIINDCIEERQKPINKLEEAISLIEKQKYMYVIQLDNLSDNIKTKTIQKATNQLKKKIQILEFILKILKKQKK